jgi:hypothetical protein
VKTHRLWILRSLLVLSSRCSFSSPWRCSFWAANSFVATWIRGQRPVPAGPGCRLGPGETCRGLEEALVEFFASSKASSRIVAVLAAHQKAVAFNVLVDELRTEQERRHDGEYLPMSAMRAVLGILQVVRIVRMNRDGFLITDLGREVYRRMISESHPRTPSAQVNLSAVRQHGRRDYSMATSRASSRALGRVSAACR